MYKERVVDINTGPGLVISLSLTFFSFSFVSARSRTDWWYALLVFCTVDSSMSQTYCLGGLGEEGEGEERRKEDKCVCVWGGGGG